MRKLALLVAVLLVLALGAVAKGSTVEVACGPTVTTPLTVRGVHAGQKAGATLRRMQDGDISEWDAVMAVKGVLDTIALWYSSLHHAANDLPEDQVVTGWKTRTKESQEQALASCCLPATPPPPSDPAPPVPPQGEPFDPKTASLRVSTRETVVWQALRSAGFNPVHTAGVMGNMKDESGFDPQIIQGGRHSTRPADARGGGYGLVQWTPGRKLSDYIGDATPTVSNQVATLKSQLAGQGPHPEERAGAVFYATKDVRSAARVFHLRYERSASKDSTSRIRNAEDIYQRLQGEPVPEVEPPAPTTPAPVACAPAALPASAPAPPVVSADFSQFKNPRTPEQAIARMKAEGAITPNKCLAYVRGAYGWGHSMNGTNAKDRWYTTPASLRHPDDWNAPRGALLVWGIREGHPGHIAISLGDGTIISTDVPRNGAIGVRPASYFKNYGQYLGWIPPYFDGQTTIERGANA